MRRKATAAALEVEHNGNVIKYSEEDNRWSCEEMNISGKLTLKAAKAALDDMNREERRLNVIALYLRDKNRYSFRGGELIVEEVTVTVICPPPRYKETPDECWITFDKQREKVSIHHLYPLDARPKLEAFLAFQKAAREAEKVASKAREQLPSYTYGTLRATKEEA